MRTRPENTSPLAGGYNRALRAESPLESFRLDPRDSRALLAHVLRLAKHIPFYEAGDAPSGAWSDVLGKDPLPALALFLEDAEGQTDRPARIAERVAVLPAPPIAEAERVADLPAPPAADAEHAAVLPAPPAADASKPAADAAGKEKDARIPAEQPAEPSAIDLSEDYEPDADNGIPALIREELNWQNASLAALEQAGLTFDLPPVAPLPDPETPAAERAGFYAGLAAQLGLRRAAMLREGQSRFAALLDRPDGNLQAHTGLLAAFLRQYSHLQERINRLAPLHAEDVYTRVAGLRPSPARGDRVLLALLPTEDAAPCTLPAASQARGGDAPAFLTEEDTPVNAARLASVTASAPSSPPGPWLYERVMDDPGQSGAGGLWLPFPEHPSAESLRVCPTVLSLPILHLAGGERRITLRFPLLSDADQPEAAANLRRVWEEYVWQEHSGSESPPLFTVEACGPEGWFAVAEAALDLSFPMESDPAVPKNGHTAPTAPVPKQADAAVPEAERTGLTAPGAEQADTIVPEAGQAAPTTPVAEHADTAAPEAEHTEPEAERAGPEEGHMKPDAPQTGQASSPEASEAQAPPAPPELILSLRLTREQPALCVPQKEIHGLAANHPALRLTPIPFTSPAPIFASASDTAPPLTPATASTPAPVSAPSPIPSQSPVWEALNAFRTPLAHVAVSVSGLWDFTLSANGQVLPLEPGAPAEVFGPTPGEGSFMDVESPEWSGKRLTSLRLHWNWNAPQSFAGYFAAYPFSGIRLAPFWKTGPQGEWEAAGASMPLEGGALRSLDCPLPPDGRLQACRWRVEGEGSLFGHADHPALLARLTIVESSLWRRLWAFVTRAPRLKHLRPPYTPLWSDITLEYAAEADCDLTAPGRLAHLHPMAFYMPGHTPGHTPGHVSGHMPGHVSGHMPGHVSGHVSGHMSGHMSGHVSGHTPDASPRLFAQYAEYALHLELDGPTEHTGKLPLSVYFRAQNLNPDRDAAQSPAMTVRGALLAGDESRSLRESGIMRLLLDAASDESGRRTAGFYWAQRPAFALQAVALHAAWAVARSDGMGAAGAASGDRPFPLPAGALTEVIFPDASVLPVAQLYPSIGGRPGERGGSASFMRDSAEYLSHRNQAVLPRDYERLVLREFPEVMAVRCLPRCGPDLGGNTPGAVALVVFAPPQGSRIHGPDGSFSLDPGLPAYADDALLRAVRGFLQAHASPFVRLAVMQPRYEALRIFLRGTIAPGIDAREAAGEARRALAAVVAPWAFAPEKTLFGASLRGEFLLQGLESLPWLASLQECLVTGADGTSLAVLRQGEKRNGAVLAPLTPAGLFCPVHTGIDFTEAQS